MKTTILLIFLYILADQIVQPKVIQILKSKSTAMLLAHVLIAAIPIWIAGAWVSYISADSLFVFRWTITLMVIHFIVDWPLSRAQDYFWEKRNKHAFILLFALEQLIMTVSTVYLFDHFLYS